MDDLVKRLRKKVEVQGHQDGVPCWMWQEIPLQVEAADKIDRLTAENAALREIIDRLRPCKVCKGSGDHKTDEQRWGKSSRNNCRHCHGFGYVLTGNRAKFRAAIDAGKGE